MHAFISLDTAKLPLLYKSLVCPALDYANAGSPFIAGSSNDRKGIIIIICYLDG